MARVFDLPETKGVFQIKGKATGVSKDKFYNEKKTKTGKTMRTSNFGVEYDKDKTLFVNVQGYEQDNVFFYKRGDKTKNIKGETEKVSWYDRFTFNKEGYNLIGMNVGLKKKVDENGNTVNDKHTVTDFDACKEIAENLKDNTSLFLKGSIDYSSFTDDKGTKRCSVKLMPNQISLCKDVDFAVEDFSPQSNFSQVIIFMGIEQEKENEKPTGRFVVLAKVVTYSNIEDVEFIIENPKLANLFKKNLKKYNAIKVNGNVVASVQTETVDDDDNWGEADAMEKVYAPTKREFIITGAKGSSIDKELYSEEKINEALAAINKARNAVDDFGDEDDWAEFDDDEELPFD